MDSEQFPHLPDLSQGPPELEDGALFPRPIPVFVVNPVRPRYWIHILLLLVTMFTTLVVGARIQNNFQQGIPVFHDTDDFFPLMWIWERPSRLTMGIPFSLSLLTILLAHEMGHYLYCRKHGVEASLPYFIPAPTLAGTMGALIRIRSRIPSLPVLFDIGIAGPIGGMLVVIPATIAGILLSKPMPADPNAGLVLGTPLFYWLCGAVLRPGLPHPLFENVLPHPVLVAAWTGGLVTALNLLPGGQLDGGHILYALWPNRHRRITLMVAIALWVVGIVSWPGWIVWGTILMVFRKHPPIVSTPVLDRNRQLLALVALLLFLGTFALNPFPNETTFDLIQQLLGHGG